MAIEPTRRLFNVVDYYRMAETGVIGPDERVELLDGEIIRMNPIGPPHATCVDQVNYHFVTRLGDRATIRVQGPIRLNDLSEPEPDVSVLRQSWPGPGHPGPDDVYLLVEVADTSLRFDRGVKLGIYARSRIPEVWIIDVPGRAVEVYREPGPGGYGFAERVDAAAVGPAAFPDVTFTLAELLGA